MAASVVTESDVRRSAARAESGRAIAMSAVIYEAIILVCRCRGREGCPPPSLSLFLSLHVLSSFPPRANGKGESSHRRIWTSRAAPTRSALLLAYPGILQPIVD